MDGPGARWSLLPSGNPRCCFLPDEVAGLLSLPACSNEYVHQGRRLQSLPALSGVTDDSSLAADQSDLPFLSLSPSAHANKVAVRLILKQNAKSSQENSPYCRTVEIVLFRFLRQTLFAYGSCAVLIPAEFAFLFALFLIINKVRYLRANLVLLIKRYFHVISMLTVVFFLRTLHDRIVKLFGV